MQGCSEGAQVLLLKRCKGLLACGENLFIRCWCVFVGACGVFSRGIRLVAWWCNVQGGTMVCCGLGGEAGEEAQVEVDKGCDEQVV